MEIQGRGSACSQLPPCRVDTRQLPVDGSNGLSRPAHDFVAVAGEKQARLSAHDLGDVGAWQQLLPDGPITQCSPHHKTK